ncbi:hypothetical protein FRB98_007015 [Tulasnella sp. 332]|nr:hypothetical protein FRB98_007015 [Tulasnella sp. 332]
MNNSGKVDPFVSFDGAVEAFHASWTRYQRSRDLMDLSVSIACAEVAIPRFQPQSPPSSLQSMLNNLGIALVTRFLRTNQTSDLEYCIRLQRSALSLSPNGHPHAFKTLNILNTAFMTRFLHGGHKVDLDNSIDYLRESVFLSPIADTVRAEALTKLGATLDIRYQQSNALVDLNESIEHLHESIRICPHNHAVRSDALGRLIEALRARFRRMDKLAGLDECIDFCRETLLSRPPGNPGRAKALYDLGNILQTRFERMGQRVDVDECIELQEDCLQLRSPGDPDRPNTLNSLGVALRFRYQVNGKATDLENSITSYRDALQLLANDRADRSMTLDNLGDALRLRFQLTGDRANIEECIDLHQECLQLRLVGHPYRSSTLTNLGAALQRRFERWGQMEDVNISIKLHREALSLLPVGDCRRLAALVNLSNVLRARFVHKAEMADLSESVELLREALLLCPPDHIDRSAALNNLSESLQIRYRRVRDVADLDECLKLLREALTICPLGHHDHSTALENLAAVLCLRFETSRRLPELNESIGYYRECLTLHPTGNPGRSTALTNLGAGLQIQYQVMNKTAALKESIRLHRESLLLRPVGHPARCQALFYLAVALQMLFQAGSNEVDVEECIQMYKEAAGLENASLHNRLLASCRWIVAARECASRSLGDAYTSSLDLLDRLMLVAASNRTIAVDAASYAIEKRDFQKAVELLERGRALLFTQLENYRKPLDGVEAVDKELAGRFRALSAVIADAALSTGDRQVGNRNSEDTVAKRQKQVDEWTQMLKEIRQLDGFEDFLRITPFVKLQRAAKDGPVILVNISQYGSHGIIIQRTRQPLCVSLPGATPSIMNELANLLIQTTTDRLEEHESNRILQGALQQIWYKIVEPIVLELENTLKLPRWSRIWWIPTSFAWSLPPHASGPYLPDERNLPDRYISSYTPTLSGLIHARAGHRPTKTASGPRMLVVAQAGAEGETQLPSVHEEVDVILRIAPQANVVGGEGCTRDAVLSSLEKTAWTHFSCHGHQNSKQPFKSHFSLRTRDTSLNLLDIMRAGLPQAELAVLSACHSAGGDKSTPDEAIHLTAGMMFAGFRSVVGTMWAMADEDGPVIAQEFYKYMFRHGLEAANCRDAAKALDRGVRKLRKLSVPLERWINFVHYGI